MKVKSFAALLVSTGFALLSQATEWRAREMSVVATNRHEIGTVTSVDLAFGEDNGLTNRLYVAYGDSDGGIRIGGWAHRKFLGLVTAETNAFHAVVPTSDCCRFFLEVPFAEEADGVPVKWVTANGGAYLDTGHALKGGDKVTMTVRNEGAGFSIFGTRGKNVNDRDVVAMYSWDKQVILDYCNGDYADYRLDPVAVAQQEWIDIDLSASSRTVRKTSTGEVLGTQTTPNGQEFETDSCYLFWASGSPSLPNMMKGSVSDFRWERGDECVASYLPYRFGDEVGFFDRVSGLFVRATQGTFSCAEDPTLVSPLVSVSGAISRERGQGLITARSVAVRSVTCKDNRVTADLSFGPDNGLVNKLYIAYGNQDGGVHLEDWPANTLVAEIDGTVDSWMGSVDLPETCKCCRFFLHVPYLAGQNPVPLLYLDGDGSGYVDTGFPFKGGDAIRMRLRYPSSNTAGTLLGSRPSDASQRNISATLAYNGTIILDYNNSLYSDYRCVVGEASANTWYDIFLSPSVRSVTRVSDGVLLGANETPCPDVFDTEKNGYLFWVSGSGAQYAQFPGDVASVSVERGGLPLAAYAPCRIGNDIGFFDRVSGNFVQATNGSGMAGPDDASVTSAVCGVSALCRINRSGLLLIFR